MPLPEEIAVEDLRKLSAEDVRSAGWAFVTKGTQAQCDIADMQSFIKLKDPWNLTAEHVERLRVLVNGLDNSRPLELGVLDEKLRNLAETTPASPRWRSSLSSTPDPRDEAEDILQDTLDEEREAYHALVQDGGRPSHPPDTGFGVLEKPGDDADIIVYWTSFHAPGRGILAPQLRHWQKFREYQDRMRKKYADPENFEKRTQFIRDYRGENGLPGHVTLLQDRKEQSRLDDWKEFQFREYRKAEGFIREMEHATEAIKASESRLQAARAAGLPADEIELMKEHGLTMNIARRGTAELELKRHAVLLRWIDQQLPIVASESTASGTRVEGGNEHRSGPGSIHLGKRKRSTDDPTERTARHRKLSESCHVTSSRCEAEVYKAPDSAVSPAMNIDGRGSTLVHPPQNLNAGFQPRRSKRIADQRREEKFSDLAATAFRHGGSSKAKNGQGVKKRVATPSSIRTRVLNTSCAASRTSQTPGSQDSRSGCSRLRKRAPRQSENATT